MTRVGLLLLCLLGQEAPKYRYVRAPVMPPGATLYAYWESGPRVPVARDVFAHRELQKAILAADRKGVEELEASGRLFAVPVGAAVKVLQYRDDAAAGLPTYEVRVLDGPHRDRKGFVVAGWLRLRAVDAPPKARRKRR